MKRAGFTMIELIFVIVILGILAAVAIPRLSATRDDAEATTLVANAKQCVSDVAAFFQSQGAMPVVADLQSCAAANAQTAGTIVIGANDVTVAGTINAELNQAHIVSGQQVVR